jgi:hypothetical protein
LVYPESRLTTSLLFLSCCVSSFRGCVGSHEPVGNFSRVRGMANGFYAVRDWLSLSAAMEYCMVLLASPLPNASNQVPASAVQVAARGFRFLRREYRQLDISNIALSPDDPRRPFLGSPATPRFTNAALPAREQLGRDASGSNKRNLPAPGDLASASRSHRRTPAGPYPEQRPAKPVGPRPGPVPTNCSP